MAAISVQGTSLTDWLPQAVDKSQWCVCVRMCVCMWERESEFRKHVHPSSLLRSLALILYSVKFLDGRPAVSTVALVKVDLVDVAVTELHGNMFCKLQVMFLYKENQEGDAKVWTQLFYCPYQRCFMLSCKDKRALLVQTDQSLENRGQLLCIYCSCVDFNGQENMRKMFNNRM